MSETFSLERWVKPICQRVENDKTNEIITYGWIV